MKKLLLVLILLSLFQYKSFAAIAIFKTKVDIDYGSINGTITIASSKKEQVMLKPYSDMQIFTDDKRVVFDKNSGIYMINTDEFAPVIISYIKKPTKHIDKIDKNFISIYTSIVPLLSNIENIEVYLTMPEGFSGLVSEFTTIDKEMKRGNTFYYTYERVPKSIYLVASKDYVIKTIMQNNVKIFSLLFKEHENLSYKILQKSAYYIEMYEKLFNVKFPYDSFMVVEDILPYGHALNGMAVFGKAIIDKPFIYERSLGHEVLHQYFGSSIECNMTDGNFLEALTTYFSDYFYEKYNRIKYRKDVLAEYEAYVGSENFPLKDFEYNSGKKQQAVGYGKGLMVLHMAKNIVGEEKFINRIRAFTKDKMFSNASWYDLLMYIGVDEDFYKTWILGKENIALFLDNITYKDKELSFNIIRKGGQAQVMVPFTHISNGNIKTGNFLTNIGNNNILYKLNQDNDTFILDNAYHLMRHLYTSEISAAFYYIFGSKDIVYIGQKNTDKLFQDVFDNIKEVVHIRKLNIHHIKDKNVIISLDNNIPANVLDLLKGSINFTFDMGNTTYAVIKNPYSKGNKFIMFAFNTTKDSLKRLTHYGSYSFIAFKDNQVVNKKEDSSSYGIKIYGKN